MQSWPLIRGTTIHSIIYEAMSGSQFSARSLRRKGQGIKSFCYFIGIKAIINFQKKNYYVTVSILINNIFIFAGLKKRILKIIC